MRVCESDNSLNDDLTYHMDKTYRARVTIFQTTICK